MPMDREAPTSKKIVGIIYPPPEVRNIIDKTALFVARNGLDFEAKIRKNESENPKFAFLRPGDPYHAYYRMKSQEDPETLKAEAGNALTQQQKEYEREQNLLMQTSKKKDIIAFTEPPPELEFSVTVPTISAQDIAIVKLTAQFVAKNGKGFLQSLMQREVRNYHFDFLKPHHSLFFYFTKLVEQYTKVMLPPKGTKEVLQKDGKSPYNALGRVEHRLNWKKQENAKKEAANKDVENERKAFLSINWADFVVVETVPFAEDDTSELPPPVNRQTIAQRILDQERLQTKKKAPAAELVPEAEAENEGENAEENEADVEEVEMEMEDEEDMQMSSPEAEAPPTLEPETVVVKPYDPKAQSGGAAAVLMQQCPNCKEMISTHQIEEHIRIELLDPRWRDQKDRMQREKQTAPEVYASASNMEASLKHMAQFRTDIFGNEKETDIGKKIGKESVPQTAAAAPTATVHQAANPNAPPHHQQLVMQQQAAAQQAAAQRAANHQQFLQQQQMQMQHRQQQQQQQQMMMQQQQQKQQAYPHAQPNGSPSTTPAQAPKTTDTTPAPQPASGTTPGIHPSRMAAFGGAKGAAAAVGAVGQQPTAAQTTTPTAPQQSQQNAPQQQQSQQMQQFPGMRPGMQPMMPGFSGMGPRSGFGPGIMPNMGMGGPGMMPNMGMGMMRPPQQQGQWPPQPQQPMPQPGQPPAKKPRMDGQQ